MGTKCRRVFAFQMRQTVSTYRIPLIFILEVVFVSSSLTGVSDFSADVGIAATPWAFPHITSDYICQLFIMAGAVALFCDAPFHSELERYILPRTGHMAWAMGECMYIFVLSLLYMLFILLTSILPLTGSIDWRNSWGKIWGTLARTSALSQYGVAFSVYDSIIGMYTPLEATTLSFLLSWACCVWLGLLAYFLNYVTGKSTGTLAAAGFVLMDITVANEWSPWFYKLSPVTLAQLQALAGRSSIYELDLGYALWFFGLSIVCLLAGCIAAPKLKLWRERK